jgi:hypothetical protein
LNPFLPHRWWFFLPGMVLLGIHAVAQITLDSVRVLSGNGPQVEIVTSAPVSPTIQQLDGPPRLVIDLPNTEFRRAPERIGVNNGPVEAVRVDEHQDSPPVARVVVDLKEPVGYGTQTQGTRLLVSFPISIGVRTANAAANDAALPAPIPLGRATFSGSIVLPGSAVTAGSDTAILRLGRGGEVWVCPGTSVSLTPAPNGHDMMLGMNTGAVEVHYALAASSPSSSDSVMTPDFRIVLTGPGEFHAAIHADSRGNTCVRTLPGNTAPIKVSELMGDGTYQVKPSEQITFRAGQIKQADNQAPPTCGCPTPVAPIATSGPEMQPLPSSKPSDVHVSVDAPFVFNANAPKPAALATLSVVIRDSEALPVMTRVRIVPLGDVVIPPSVQAGPAKPVASAQHGFLGKIRRFFGAIFR